MRNIGLAALAVMALSGCASGNLAGANAPSGEAAYAALAPSTAQARADPDYRIGPLDSIAISVYQEPEISTPPNSSLQVNANGNIAMPLIGTIPASGKTASELGAFIAGRLSENYLKNPQVNVTVVSSVSQKVTVQGEVTQAGVYEIKGRSTLLDAIALARGETRVASLDRVLVYRQVNGQRVGALFNVQDIRKGKAVDPEILGNDMIVVGASQSKSIWRDFLATAPMIGMFAAF